MTLGKSVTDFLETSHRLLGSSVFGKNSFCFWEKHAPFLGKNRLRVWEEQAPFLGQSGSVLGKNRLCLRGGIGSVLDWLGTKLKSHCFER